MSNIPRIDPDVVNKLRQQISAAVLSGVVGLFVVYWVTYGIQTLIHIMFSHADPTPVSWGLSILVGIIVGVYSGIILYNELENYVKR